MWGSEGTWLEAFLTLALAGSEWSASCSCCFISEERTLATHWIEDRVDFVTGLDDVWKT
jgi:hypothetical protein